METVEAEEGYVGLYLFSSNTKTIKAKYSLSIIDNGGRVLEEVMNETFIKRK
jgi:hypothetical protein